MWPWSQIDKKLKYFQSGKVVWRVDDESLEVYNWLKKSFVAKWNISFCLPSFVNGHYYSLWRHGTSTTHFFAQELLSFFRGGLSKTLGHSFPFVKLSLQQQQHKYTRSECTIHHFQQPKTTASTNLKLKVVQLFLNSKSQNQYHITSCCKWINPLFFFYSR